MRSAQMFIMLREETLSHLAVATCERSINSENQGYSQVINQREFLKGLTDY